MSAVSTSYGTYLSNLFNPQVVGDRINKKLWDYVRFSPLARIDNTLEGRPGNTITLPYYNKSITAQVVNEGQDITLSQLTESTTTVTIKKIAAGCQITDEALLSAYGNPRMRLLTRSQEQSLMRLITICLRLWRLVLTHL